MGRWSHRGRVGITLTKARTRSQKAPQPQVSGSLWHHCQALHGNTSALLTEGGAERHMRSCTGKPGWGPSHPAVQASGKGPPLHSLDDSTLLPLEGGARGWPGQQQLLLMNQAVKQVFLAVVVVNLQERQGGDRQPSQPRGPQAKLHGTQSGVSEGGGFVVHCLLYHLPALALRAREGCTKARGGSTPESPCTPVFGLFSAVTAMSNTYKDPGLHGGWGTLPFSPALMRRRRSRTWVALSSHPDPLGSAEYL